MNFVLYKVPKDSAYWQTNREFIKNFDDYNKAWHEKWRLMAKDGEHGYQIAAIDYEGRLAYTHTNSRP